LVQHSVEEEIVQSHHWLGDAVCIVSPEKIGRSVVRQGMMQGVIPLQEDQRTNNPCPQDYQRIVHRNVVSKRKGYVPA
jgi:hypothetical protein